VIVSHDSTPAVTHDDPDYVRGYFFSQMMIVLAALEEVPPRKLPV